MKTQRTYAAAAAAVALLLLGGGLVSAARAEDGATTGRVSILGGVHVLNQNDTALPDNFINVPIAAALAYDLSPNWAIEGEFGWLIPVKRSVDLGAAGTQDRKSPDILTYQASVLAKLPVSGTPWTPYVSAGLGAVTFLSSTDADRFPQLTDSQTAFAFNLGAGTTYGLGPR